MAPQSHGGSQRGRLDLFIELCVETREIDLLAERVDAADAPDLESISHYVTERAARLRCAMAMRILDAGKSKYYLHALEHPSQGKGPVLQAGPRGGMAIAVARIRKDHARKHGFMAPFEEIVAGGDRPAVESFQASSQEEVEAADTRRLRRPDCPTSCMNRRDSDSPRSTSSVA